MKTSRVGTLVVTVFACLTLRAACGAEAGAPAASNDRERPEEFIVTAKALQDLRLKIRLAEEEVYARFNDINSDDSHDIHCYDRVATGSHVPKRRCLSNAWRTAEARIAQLTVNALQSASDPGALYGAATPTANAGGGQAAAGPTTGGAGYSGGSTGQYRVNQLRTEQLVLKELRQLANEDPALHDAMVRAGQAYQALETVTGSRPEWTLYRDVQAGEDGLPFGAKRLVEVRVGQVAWNHSLTSHTFTIGSVTGRIRDLRIRCGKVDKKLEYKEEVDWTLPDSWADCTLAVSAKRGTTFALYEF
jgi:hypothetical protein